MPKQPKDRGWRKTDMRGCSHPPGAPGKCQRVDLIVYNRIRNGKLETGHEWPPGEKVLCGVRVELKPGEGRKA